MTTHLTPSSHTSSQPTLAAMTIMLLATMSLLLSLPMSVAATSGDTYHPCLNLTSSSDCIAHGSAPHYCRWQGDHCSIRCDRFSESTCRNETWTNGSTTYAAQCTALVASSKCVYSCGIYDNVDDCRVYDCTWLKATNSCVTRCNHVTTADGCPDHCTPDVDTTISTTTFCRPKCDQIYSNTTKFCLASARAIAEGCFYDPNNKQCLPHCDRYSFNNSETCLQHKHCMIDPYGRKCVPDCKYGSHNKWDEFSTGLKCRKNKYNSISTTSSYYALFHCEQGYNQSSCQWLCRSRFRYASSIAPEDRALCGSVSECELTRNDTFDTRADVCEYRCSAFTSLKECEFYDDSCFWDNQTLTCNTKCALSHNSTFKCGIQDAASTPHRYCQQGYIPTISNPAKCATKCSYFEKEQFCESAGNDCVFQRYSSTPVSPIVDHGKCVRECYSLSYEKEACEAEPLCAMQGTMCRPNCNLMVNETSCRSFSSCRWSEGQCKLDCSYAFKNTSAETCGTEAWATPHCMFVKGRTTFYGKCTLNCSLFGANKELCDAHYTCAMYGGTCRQKCTSLYNPESCPDHCEEYDFSISSNCREKCKYFESENTCTRSSTNGCTWMPSEDSNTTHLSSRYNTDGKCVTRCSTDKAGNLSICGHGDYSHCVPHRLKQVNSNLTKVLCGFNCELFNKNLTSGAGEFCPYSDLCSRQQVYLRNATVVYPCTTDCTRVNSRHYGYSYETTLPVSSASFPNNETDEGTADELLDIRKCVPYDHYENSSIHVNCSLFDGSVESCTLLGYKHCRWSPSDNTCKVRCSALDGYVTECPDHCVFAGNYTRTYQPITGRVLCAVNCSAINDETECWSADTGDYGNDAVRCGWTNGTCHKECSVLTVDECLSPTFENVCTTGLDYRNRPICQRKHGCHNIPSQFCGVATQCSQSTYTTYGGGIRVTDCRRSCEYNYGTCDTNRTDCHIVNNTHGYHRCVFDCDVIGDDRDICAARSTDCTWYPDPDPADASKPHATKGRCKSQCSKFTDSVQGKCPSHCQESRGENGFSCSDNPLSETPAPTPRPAVVYVPDPPAPPTNEATSPPSTGTSSGGSTSGGGISTGGVQTFKMLSMTLSIAGDTWATVLENNSGPLKAAIKKDLAQHFRVNESSITVKSLTIGSLIIEAVVDVPEEREDVIKERITSFACSQVCTRYSRIPTAAALYQNAGGDTALIQATTSAHTGTESRQVKGSSTFKKDGIIIGVLIGVVVLAGVGIVFFVVRGKRVDDDDKEGDEDEMKASKNEPVHNDHSDFDAVPHDHGGVVEENPINKEPYGQRDTPHNKSQPPTATNYRV